jgi:HEAT repeat protein
LSAVPALIEALEDPYPSVRSAAARSLGKLGGPAARAALAEARAEERDPTVASVIDHARASAP